MWPKKVLPFDEAPNNNLLFTITTDNGQSWSTVSIEFQTRRTVVTHERKDEAKLSVFNIFLSVSNMCLKFDKPRLRSLCIVCGFPLHGLLNFRPQ